MSVATILTILSLVNGLIDVAKGAPQVAAEAKSLLSKVQPYVAEAGVDVATEFEAARERLAAL